MNHNLKTPIGGLCIPRHPGNQRGWLSWGSTITDVAGGGRHVTVIGNLMFKNEFLSEPESLSA